MIEDYSLFSRIMQLSAFYDIIGSGTELYCKGGLYDPEIYLVLSAP